MTDPVATAKRVDVLDVVAIGGPAAALTFAIYRWALYDSVPHGDLWAHAGAGVGIAAFVGVLLAIRWIRLQLAGILVGLATLAYVWSDTWAGPTVAFANLLWTAFVLAPMVALAWELPPRARDRWTMIATAVAGIHWEVYELLIWGEASKFPTARAYWIDSGTDVLAVAVAGVVATALLRRIDLDERVG